MRVFEVSTGRVFDAHSPDVCSPDFRVGRIDSNRDPLPDVAPSVIVDGFVLMPDLSGLPGRTPEHERMVQGGATSGWKLAIIRKPTADIEAEARARDLAAGFQDVAGVLLRFTGDRLTKLSHAILRGLFPVVVSDDKQTDHTIADPGEAAQLEARFL